MDAPTAADIREWSKLDFAALDYAVADPDPLEPLVETAGALITAITGQTYAAMPTEFEALARLAARGMTEQLVEQAQPEYLETLADFDLIKAFSAGPYSETRRDAVDAMKARMLNAWPWLSDLLWRMLTPEKYDYWQEFFMGGEVPAFATTEMEWNNPNWGWDPRDPNVFGA